jgi:hypothetical protein
MKVAQRALLTGEPSGSLVKTPDSISFSIASRGLHMLSHSPYAVTV